MNKCSIDRCEKLCKRGTICYMHLSRYKRNGSYDLVRISLSNDPSKVTENIKICKIHGNLEHKNIYFLPNSNHKFCKLCQHINRTKKRNKSEREQKYILLRKDVASFFCEKCKTDKARNEFSEKTLKNKNLWCKNCFRESSRNSELKLKFGITEKIYEKILKKQKNKCAICRKPENIIHHHSKKIVKMAVDHCHKTKKVRGLLCGRCNFGIGYFKDSIKLLKMAINYLEKME
jgi:Recombination endonuclease VII